MKKVPVGTGSVLASREILQGTLTLALLGVTVTVAPPASADEECGPAAGETLITCNAAGGPYQTITYNTSTGLTLHLEDGFEAEDVSGIHDTVLLVGTGSDLLRVEVAQGANVAGHGPYMHGVKVSAEPGSTSDVEIEVFGNMQFDSHKPASDLGVSAAAGGYAGTGAAGNITIVQHAGSEILANGFDAGGLTAIQSGSGTTSVITAGRIVVTNSEEAAGADAWGYPTSTGAILVEQLATGSIDTTGYKSAGVAGGTLGSGDVTVRAAGSLTTHGDLSHGLHAWMLAPTTVGLSTLQLLAGGNVLTEGSGSHGMYVENPGLGASLAESAGTIRTQGDFSHGLSLQVDVNNTAPMHAGLSGNAQVETSGAGSHGVHLAHSGTGAASVSLQDSARIQTTGDQAHGVDITSGSGGATLLQQAGSSISTAGEVATGIEVNSAGDVQATLAGSVSTSGTGSYAVALNTTAGTVTADLLATARIQTTGDSASGLAITSMGDVTLSQAAGAVISSQGEHALGIAIWADNDVMLALDGTVAAEGESSSAVLLRSQAGSVRVDIGADTSITGGTGLWLSSGVGSTVLHAGSISAASDVAVVAESGSLEFGNAGEVTGNIRFANAAGNRFENTMGGTLTLRHFADTDGDGQRDTRRVAISDFGSGNAVFVNEGVVRLGAATGAASIAAGGYYVPATGAGNLALSGPYDPGRVEQAQLVNLGTFVHSGIIDLRGVAAGNSLVITSNAAAGGAAGTATFVSNGGELHLSATLDGSAVGGGYADMLVVDRTALGSAPTSIHLHMSAAAIGAATQGNGIQLVEVRDKSASADGVFILPQNVSSGLYEYSLRHHGIGADAADGNWYVRNTVADPANPGQEYPAYRDSIPTLVMVQSQAARVGLGTLGTYHDRVGEHYADREAQGGNQRRAAWGRWLNHSSNFSSGGNTMAEQDAQFREHGPSYDHELKGLQVGQDLITHTSHSGATQVFGLHAGFAEAHSRVSAVYGGNSGTSRLDSAAAGIYWTWRASGGAYLDALLQATDYDAEATLQGQTQRVESDGRGYAASLEGGAPLHLRGGWLLEPQAQLVYQKIHFDDALEQSAQVAHMGARALDGRLGTRIARNWISPAGQTRSAWLRMHAWHDFNRQSTARVGSIGSGGIDAVDVHADLGGTRGQLQLAMSGELDKDFSAFASGDYDFALDGRGGNGYGLRFGFRRMW